MTSKKNLGEEFAIEWLVRQGLRAERFNVTQDIPLKASPAPPSGWNTPSQAWEARVVSIKGDPLAAGFERQGCIPCVGHQVAIGARLSTQSRKYRPVLGPRFNENTMARLHDQLTKLYAFSKTARFYKDLGVRHNSNNAT